MEVFKGLKKLVFEERSTEFKFTFTVNEESGIEASKKKKKIKKSKRKNNVNNRARCGADFNDCEENENQADENIATTKSPFYNNYASHISPSKQLFNHEVDPPQSSSYSSSLSAHISSGEMSSSSEPPLLVTPNRSNNKKKNKNSKKNNKAKSSSSDTKEEGNDWEEAIAESLRLDAIIEQVEEKKALLGLVPSICEKGPGPVIISSHDPSLDDSERILRKFGKGKCLVNVGPAKFRDHTWLLGGGSIHDSTIANGNIHDSTIANGNIHDSSIASGSAQLFHSSAFTFSFDGL